MAENVFAVSLRRGLATHEIDEAEVVSCGGAIQNVAIKEVDGQIWVRSPASLTAYLGGDDIRDEDGFYPTGDLGRIIDGELYITGRKQDLIIQAGRKFMLSDIDLALNRLFPWIRGRAAAVQTYDVRLGTQKPLVLIESEDFFLRRDQGEIAAALRDAIGLDQVGVEFVPPRFLTKTSSGKFNRKKSAADWLLAQKMREMSASGADPLAEMKENFAHLDWNKPVKDILDSLSLEVLRIILSSTPVRYDAGLSLSELAAKLDQPVVSQENVIRIVSLADRANFQRLRQTHLDALSALLGAPVTFEHLCLPPSPIILSDLIFHDYFQGRVEQGNFAAVNAAVALLRSASAIIIDDMAEMVIGGAQVYGALSHNLERDPHCDLISFRWQRYAKYHDTLPLTLVAGMDLPFCDRSAVLEMLGAYLHKPILKITTDPGLAEFTKEWDYRPSADREGARPAYIEMNDFVRAFADWASQRPEPLKTFPPTGGDALQMNDLGHFCSHFVEQSLVDSVIAKFDRFCIAGQRSSLPYVRMELERQNKSFVYAASYAPEILKELPEAYDCVVICGPQGKYKIEGPAVALMRAGGNWRTQNIDDPSIARHSFNMAPEGIPESGQDWFYPFSLDRGKDAETLQSVRVVLQSTKEKIKDNRARRVQERTRRQERLEQAKSAKNDKLEQRKREWHERRRKRRGLA
jgi:hypothetical protein